MKIFTRFIVSTLFITTAFLNVHAQCALSGYSPGGVGNPPCASFSSINVGSGAYGTFNCVNGASYTISTCGSSFDTQISGYDASTNGYISGFYNDDYGPDCSGAAQASLNWTASFTGTVKVMVNQWPCTGWVSGGASAVLKFRQNAPTITSSNATMCSGATRALTADQSGGTWSGTGVSSSTFTAPATAGNYVITYSIGQCSASQTIAVNSNSVAPTSITGTTTICSGQSTTLTVSGGSAGTGASVQWFTGSCGGTSAGTGNSITVSPTSSTTYYVRYSGTCNTTTCASVIVTVNSNSVAAGSISALPNPVCAGSSSTLSVVGGSLGTGASWNWYSGSCGGPGAGSGTSISVNPLSSTTYFVRAMGTCNNTACVSTTLTVDPIPTNITPTALATAVCTGQSTSIQVPSSQSGVNYQLRIGTTNVGSAQTGNGGTLSLSTGALSSNTTFNVLAYNNYGANCSIQLTPSITITVQTPPTAYSVTGGGSYCSGGTGVAVGLSNSQSGVNYQLQLNGVNTGGSVAGSGAAISFGNQTAGGTYTVVATNSASPNCTANMTGSVTVTVIPFPSAAGTISGTAIVCQGQSGVSYSVGAIANATGYTWSYSGTGGSIVGSGTSITMNFSSGATSGNLTVYGSNTCGVGATSANFSITVNQTPAATATPSTATICSGTAPSISLSSNLGGTTFGWTTSQGSGISGAVNCSSSCGTTIAQVLSNSGTTPGSATYNVTPTANGCAGTAIPVVITVNPTPIGSASGQTICSGATTGITLNSTVTGTTFTWNAALVSGSLTTGFGNCVSSCGTTIAQTLTNTSNAAATVRYTVTPTAASCAGSPFTVDVIVNPIPVVTPTNNAPSICTGSNTNIALSSNVGGTSFSWTASGTAGTGGYSASSGSTISQTLTNTNPPSGTVTYTITPTANTCVGSSVTSSVTVYQQPSSNAGSDFDLCIVTFPAIFNLNAVSPSVGTGQWSQVSGPGTAFISNINSNTSAVQAPLAGVYVFRWAVTNVVPGCTTNDEVTVNVYQQPIANAGTDATECDLDHTMSATPANAGTGTWIRVSGPAGYSFSNANSPTSTVTVTGYGTHVFRWTVVNGSCSAQDEMSITFYVQPVAVAGPGGSECDLDFDFNASLNVGVGTWTQQSGPGTTTYAPNANSATATATATAFGTYVYRWTGVNGTCSNFSETTVNYYDLPDATISGDTTICFDGTATISIALTGEPPWSVTYEDNNGNSTTVNNIFTSPYTFTTTDSLTYIVTNVTDGHTCSNEGFGSAQVQIFPTPAIPTISGGLTSFCEGQSQIFYSSLAEGYLWSPTSEIGQYILVNSSGTYTVTTTDINGCQQTSLPTVVTVHSNPTPEITPAGPVSLCQGNDVLLSTVIPYSSYLWSNAATTSFITVNNTGNFSVQVTDGFGCQGTSSVVAVTVHPLPTPTITPFGNGTSFCQGQSVNLLASGASSYLWSPGGQTSQVISVNSSGSYAVTVTDVYGCVNTSAATDITVTPNPTPTITPGGPTTFCQGGSVVLTSSSATGNVWTPGGQTTQAITVTASGSYSVSVTDGNGCSGTSAVTTVTVNTLPTAFITASGSTTFCQGGSVTLTSNSATGNLWSPGGQTTQSITVSTGGSYTVTVTNGNNCSATSPTTTVTVSPNPAPTISAGGPTTFCQGGSVVLTSTIATGNVWSPSGQNTQSITVSASGTYSVTNTNVNGCSGTSNAITVTVNPNPTDNITPSGPTAFCQGGSVILTADAAAAYLWSPGGQTTQAITVSASGSYSVTVTNGFSCSTTSSATVVTVNPNPAPTISAGGATTFCQGGSVTLTSTIATGNIWSPGGQNTQSITVSASGSYSVTNTNGNGCSGTSNTTAVTVNPNPAPTITPSGPTSFCIGGSVILTSSSASGNVWSPGGQVTQSITVSATGNYSVTVTDGNSCSGTSAVTAVTVNPLPTPTVTPQGPTTFCQGGSVVLSSNSLTGNLWSPGGQTTQNITVSATGNYSVTITDVNGCTATSALQSVTVNPNPTPTITPSGATTFCAGGSVTLTSSSATNNSWLPGLETTQAITVTTSGNYRVSVTDGNGCTGLSAITVVTVNPNPVPTITPDGGTTFCTGGSVNLTSSSASSYSWSPGGETTQTINVTASGNYSVTVVDANGCTGTSAATTVTATALPAPVITPLGPTTFCQGESVTLFSSSSTGNVWSPGGETTQFITVSTAADYTVTVTTGGGCDGASAPVSVVVNPLPTPSISAGGPTTFCQGGSVTLTATAAAAYLWSNGQTTQSITVSSSGSFTVTVTDANGCQGTTAATTVTVNPLPTPTITAGGPTTFCQGGSVTLTATASAAYLWSPGGETTQSITVSASGTFDVTVTNGNNCTATSASTTVTVNPLPTPVVSAGGPVTFCAGGDVTLTSNYITGNIWSNGQVTQSILVNTSGNYSVTVTDGNGCSATSAATTVTVNPMPVASITAGGPTTFCQGGSVTLTSASATGNVWSPGGETTQSITVSASGTFSVTVSNVYSCIATSANTVVTVNPLPTPTVTAGGPTTFCNGGSVTLTSNYVSGNLWSTGAVTQSITVSATGSYTVTETDGNGCSATSAATAVTVNPNPTPTITPGGPTTFCQGGSVTLTTAAATTYLWSPGGETTQTITVSTSGTYSVTVSDVNGCSGTSASTTVTVNTLPTSVITPLSPTTFCQGESVVLFSSSGTGNLWAPGGQTTQFITVSASGTFTVTVTNGFGCSTTSAPVTVTVNPLPTPAITPSGPTTFCQGGSVNLTATAAASYVWLPGGQTTQSITVSQSGNYTVTITDGNGCSATSASQTVTVNPLPVPTIVPAGAVSICNGSSVTLTASAASAYLWSPGGQTTQSITVSAAGSYNVTVTDANGCSATSQATTVTLQNNPVPVITPMSTTTFCQGGSVTLFSSQASNYLWAPNGETTQFIVVTQTGNYTVSVSDGNGCNGTSAPTLVTVNPSPTVSFTGLDPDYCVDASAVILAGSPVGGAFTGPVIGNTFNPAFAGVGTYTVTYTYTNGSGCSGTSSQQVIVNPLPVVSFSGLDSEYCIDEPGVTLVGSPSGGTYSGPGISGTSFIPALATAGTHTITYTYTDGNGCTNSSSQTVIVHPLPVLSIAGLDPAYCVDAGNTTLAGTPSGGTFSGTGMSGNTFSPSTAGVGTHIITYAYTDGYGCSNTVTQSVIVNPLPVVSFNVLETEYCISETSVALTGSPSGGTFSGTGVTGNIFNPSLAGAGSHVITYTYTDINGCTNTSSQTAVVVNLPVVSFTGLDPEYCLDGGLVTLTGNPVGGTFSGAGISGNTFNPSVAGIGQHTIIYTYSDVFGCVNSSSQNVVVNALPVVNFTGLGLDYCVDENTATLSGYPSGGTFSGPGVSGNTFSPAVAGPGVHTITFSYTDGNSCTATLSQTVTVYDLPVVNINPVGTQYCVSATTVNLSATPSGGIFSGQGVIGTNFNPSLAGVGNHRVVYYYNDVNGCQNRDTIYIDVVPLPVLSFTGLASQYCLNIPAVTLTGSPSGGTFSGPGISGNTFDPSVAGVGIHTVTYSYTDGNNCSNTVSQSVTVNPLPVVDFTGLAAGYCIDAPSVLLTGLPAGGGYFGDGMNGNIFSPADAGAGIHSITYIYANTNGCINGAQHQTEVFDLPSLSITNLNPQYCLTDQSVTLIATPSGGTFSGTGISGNDFSPSSAGAGTHTITYSYTDGNGCFNSITQDVIVNPLPALSLLGLGTSYCEDNTNGIQLTGVPAGGSFIGNGVVSGQFFPSVAGAGLHPVSYIYIDGNGCTGTITQNVVVNTLPSPSFSMDDSFCVTELVALSLQGTPIGGTFSGPGVLGNTFTAFNAGVGTHVILYSVTDVNGCTGTTTDTITVHDIPVVSIIGLDAFYCMEASPVTITGNPAGGTFFGTGVTGNTFDPAIAGNGTHTINYGYTDGNGCSNTATQQVQVLELAPPTITADGPTSFCEEDNVTLTAQSGFALYEWSNGALTSSIFVDTAGQFSVTVTDGNGCVAVSSPVIDVTVFELPVVNIGNDTAICLGNSLLLDAGAGFDDYVWVPGGQHTQTYTVTSAGNYRVTVTNSFGCSDFDEIQVIVNIPLQPVITANGSPSICDGDTLILNAGGGFQTYQWSNGAGTQTIAVSQTGNYSVATVDGNGCTASSSAYNVTVMPLPIVTISANGPTEMCEGNNLILSMPVGYTTYIWSTGDTTNSIIVNQEGDYTGYAENSAGCSDITPTIHVTVNPQPEPVIIPQGPVVLCYGETITLDAGNEGYDTYNWYRNLNPLTIHTQLNEVGTTGSYTVEVIDTNGCGQGVTSPPVLVTVYPQVIPVITISQDQDTLYSTPAQTYQWYFNGNAVTGANQQYYLPTESGNYLVVVTDNNDCSGSSAAIEYSYIGIDDITFNSLNLYPNPGSGRFTIRAELSQTLTIGIDISDITGRTIVPGIELKDVSSLNKDISLEEFAQGVYFVRITAGNKVQKVIRYIKE